MWLMKRVGAPVPSPDGNWVVFSMIEPAYDEKDQASDLWIVPENGSTKPRGIKTRSLGENDFRVPINQSLENWSALQRMKVPSRLIVFPDANHWILKGEDSRYFYTELHGWLKKWL